MHKPRTWALVADGVRARILRGLEDGAPPSFPPTELISRSRSQHLRDVMSDKPGRTQSSDHSGRRSSLDYGTDPIKEDMRDFAREIVDRLDSHRRARDFARLAIFAAPDMLGTLRQEMSRALKSTVFFERSQNLMHLREDDLRDRVVKEIRASFFEGERE